MAMQRHSRWRPPPAGQQLDGRTGITEQELGYWLGYSSQIPGQSVHQVDKSKSPISTV